MSTRSVQPVSRCNRRSLDTWATKRAWKISGGRQPTRPWEKNWFEQKTKGNPCCEHIRMSWHIYYIYICMFDVSKNTHVYIYISTQSFFLWLTSVFDKRVCRNAAVSPNLRLWTEQWTTEHHQTSSIEASIFGGSIQYLVSCIHDHTHTQVFFF